MKKACMLVVCGLLILISAGCETIKGIGKDVSAVGGWLTRGSEKAQNPGPGSKK